MGRRGVTLIEVLVSMSISAILVGVTMVSMTMLGRQRLTMEATTLSSDISWTKQSAITQHYAYFIDFDLGGESYSVYKDDGDDSFNSGSDTLIKERQLSVDLFCFQDLDGVDLTPTRVMFARFTGKADRDVYIELRHGGGVREISIFSDTGYGKSGKKGKKSKGRGHRGKGSCFIATAAYCGVDAAGTAKVIPEEIRVLEKFRDTVLCANALGRQVEEAYYTLSPPVAAYIEQREWAKRAVRVLLRPVVWCARKLIEEKS